MADSTFIIKYLKETYKNNLIINEIDPMRKAIVTAARIMAEEHLYFAMCALKFLTKEVYSFILFTFNYELIFYHYYK